ncbi:MAG: hypothetical protein ACRETC_00915 [Gammaproteobacteria bacterium]
MSSTTETIREKIHALADQMPAHATWDDVLEEIRFLKAVDTGITAAERGAFASEEDVKTAFKQWGVEVEG